MTDDKDYFTLKHHRAADSVGGSVDIEYRFEDDGTLSDTLQNIKYFLRSVSYILDDLEAVNEER